VEVILGRVTRQTAKVLAAYNEESEDEALAALQAAEVDRRLRYPDPFPHVRRSAARVLESLAQRDLRARVTARYQGDHGRIIQAVNATQTRSTRRSRTMSRPAFPGKDAIRSFPACTIR